MICIFIVNILTFLNLDLLQGCSCRMIGCSLVFLVNMIINGLQQTIVLQSLQRCVFFTITDIYWQSPIIITTVNNNKVSMFSSFELFSRSCSVGFSWMLLCRFLCRWAVIRCSPSAGCPRRASCTGGSPQRVTCGASAWCCGRSSPTASSHGTSSLTMRSDSVST